jgi:methylisocitrate lyase
MAGGDSPGARLRAAWREERPLQIVGAIHAYGAIMAESMGFRALYLSGAGVATASFGLPDLGMTNLSDVVEDARRITGATSLPLLVDVDTGWGSPLTVGRTVREMTRAGVAAVHIEDQITEKRCGHRPQTRIVPADEMVIRIRAAVDARTDPDFVVVARTDAYASEGMGGVIERAGRYVQAGADMVFPDALTEREHYRQLAAAIDAPLLANMTEFGRTPLMGLDELADAGVAVVLYPLSAFRAMNAAALRVYRTIRTEGTQRGLLDQMQTREDMYRLLGYEQHEQRIERWLDR